MIVSAASRHGSAAAERDARGDGLTEEEEDDDDDEASALQTHVPAPLAQVPQSLTDAPVVCVRPPMDASPGSAPRSLPA